MAPRMAPRSERIDLPAPFVDLAKRRTEFLFNRMTYGDMSMRMVLACAYVQGMTDGVDALIAKNMLVESASPPSSKTGARDGQ